MMYLKMSCERSSVVSKGRRGRRRSGKRTFDQFCSQHPPLLYGKPFSSLAPHGHGSSAVSMILTSSRARMRR